LTIREISEKEKRCCVNEVAAFAASAMAFTDIADETSTIQDAINKFAAQGIINGYENADGSYSFQPDGTITRAEMAKIAVLYTGNGYMEKLYQNYTYQFTDVKVGDWYNGWVTAAALLGIFEGNPDGTFNPNGNLTYEQLVAIALRLAGYTNDLPGDWPLNYVTKAYKVGDVNLVKAATTFDVGKMATRKDVILVFDALLDVPTVKYDKEAEAFVDIEDDDKDTVLEKFNAMNNGIEFDSDAKPFAIAYDATLGYTINGKALSANFAVSNGYTLEDLILSNITFAGKYYVVEEEVNDAIVEKVSYVDLGGKYVEGYVTAYTAATETKDGSVTVAGVDYVIPMGASAPTATKGNFVNVTLAEGKVASIDAVEADFTGAVVVKLADSKLSYDTATLAGSTGSLEIAVAENADAKTFVVIKDGVFATVDDIKVGDLVYSRATIADELGVDAVYEVISPVGEAAITSITSNDGSAVASAVINGLGYEYAIQIMTGATFETFAVEDYTDDPASTTDLVLKDKVGTFYADANGLAVAMVYTEVEEAVENTIVYGFIADGTIVTGTTGGTGLGVGATNTYLGYSDLTLNTLAGDVKYAVKDNGYKANGGESNIFAADAEGVTLDGEAVVKGMFVKATVNAENVITDLALVNNDWDTDFADTITKVDSKYNTINYTKGEASKLINFAGDVLVFQVETKKVITTPDDPDTDTNEEVSYQGFKAVTINSAADAIATLAGATKDTAINAIICVDEDGVLEAIVVSKVAAAEVKNTNYVVLESLYADGNMIKFYGDDTLYAKNAANVGESFAAGDIVTYSMTSGKISKLDAVCKLNVFADQASEVESVEGNVVTFKAAAGGNVVTTNGVPATTKTLIVSDKTLVLVYAKDATAEEDVIAKTFSAVGTAADIVKGAYVVGLDLDSDDVAAEIVIVVK